MARYHTPQISENPFHITARYHNREAFYLPLDKVWDVLCEHLYLTRHFFNLKIYSFVLMPNHFHMLCRSDTEPLGSAMGYLMRETSKTLNSLSGRTNQSWGSRYYRCEIASYHYFMNCYKYVYQNPVRANLCLSPTEWKYSTLHGLLGQSHILIPIELDTILFSDNGNINAQSLYWLKTLPTNENILALRKALKKRTLKFPLAENKKAHFLENELF